MSFNINNMLNSVQHYTYGNNSAAVVYNNPHVFAASKNTVNMKSDIACVAISENGQYILSCHLFNGAYLSNNSGNSFTSVPISSEVAWSCAISGNGKFMFIGTTLSIFRSTDFGATFALIWPPKSWSSMKISYDGSYCLASSDYVYLSSNSGTSFAVTTDTTGTNNSAGWGYNTDIAMSKTGQFMVCIKKASPYDLIKISTDFGVTWKQKNFAVLNNFSTACAMSEDGQTIYLGSYYYPKLYKITNLSADTPTITEIVGAADRKCRLILLATDPLYIFISNVVSRNMYYSINGGTNFTQISTTTYFTTGAITPDKKYIIGNDNNNNRLLYVSGP